MANEDIRRLLDLISFLRRHENTTEEEIAKLLGCSTAEVQSLLDRILMCGTPPYSPRDYVCVFREAGRVRVQFAEHFRRPVTFSPAELACLMVLLDDPMIGTDEHVGRVRERIKAKLAEATAAQTGGTQADGEPSIAIARPGSHVRRVAATIQQAIAAKRQVRLVHFSSSRFEQVSRVVDPHQLLRMGDQLYLVGYDRTHRQQILRFRVDRIAEVQPLTQPARAPNEAELERILRAEIQPGHGDTSPETETLVLRVSPQLAPYVREAFDARRVKPQADGSAVLRIPLVSDNWVLRFALAYGDEAEILEPARMRTKMAALIDRLLAGLHAA